MRSVLLISDSKWVHNDVLASLDLPGTRIAIEEDPRAAIDAAKEHLPSVYLVDMQVGSKGGMALTRRLRNAIYDGSVPPASIFMLLDRQADAFLAKRAGADGWIVKPFTAQDIRATVAAGSPAEA